jgi:hypothetical protein
MKEIGLLLVNFSVPHFGLFRQCRGYFIDALFWNCGGTPDPY